eukprot:167469-Rhodomonas_salina.2
MSSACSTAVRRSVSTRAVRANVSYDRRSTKLQWEGVSKMQYKRSVGDTHPLARCYPATEHHVLTPVPCDLHTSVSTFSTALTIGIFNGFVSGV